MNKDNDAIQETSHDEIYKQIFEILSIAERELRNKNYRSAGTQCKIAMIFLYNYANTSKPLNVLELTCCGNCYYMDIIMDKGGVCTFGGEETPCDRDGICDNWKINIID